MRLKYLVPIFVLCIVHSSHCKPAANYLTTGRGLGSTLWGWITYPFSWSRSSQPEPFPLNDSVTLPSPYGPYDNIEVAKHNVTIWCNRQTCTTMKCDKFGCRNVTCNIYDTDMRGECREYNTGMTPEEPPTKPIQVTTLPTIHDKVTISTEQPKLTTAATTTTTQANVPAEERPLELEAILSSTVTDSSPEKVSPDNKRNKSSSPQNKV